MVNHRSSYLPRNRAFTLLELLIVVAIVGLLLALLAPALSSMKTAGDLTNGAETIAALVRQGRSHAMANSTYTWVGFYEEDAGTTTPTSSTPPYPGVGKVIVATVASLDGTEIFDKSDASAPLPTNRIRQVGKLTVLSNVHVTDIGAPSSGSPDTIAGRPSAYTGGSLSYYARISSDDSNGAKTKFPFAVQGYTFHKTIRFSPRGEANINSTYSLRPVCEIGLRPTQGSSVQARSMNVAAIQFSGVAGNVKVYRR